MKKLLLQVSKLIVYIAVVFLFIEIAGIAKTQEWSSESSNLTNWGMLWQYLLFLLFGVVNHRLNKRVNKQDEMIKEMYKDMMKARDLRSDYTINHSERLNTIEYKIGIR